MLEKILQYMLVFNQSPFAKKVLKVIYTGFGVLAILGIIVAVVLEVYYRVKYHKSLFF